MKEENKILNRSRDREKWKKTLSGQTVKEAKAAAIYFRPNLNDDRSIRDLAELTGKTKNEVVEKLVQCALNNQSFSIPKLDEQNNSLRRLEDRTETITNVQEEILILLDQLRQENLTGSKVTVSLLSEIYCMVHTAVSLLRTLLLQVFRFTREKNSNAQLSPEVIASFEETSNLTIRRSLEDLKSAAAFHQINPQKLTGEKLFWKSKLKVADSDAKES